MKKIIIFIALFFCTSSFYTQTANEIIQKNLEVTGGINNWNLLNSIVIKGTTTMDIDKVYPITIYQKRPNLTHSSILLNGKKVILEAYDGKKAYQTDFYTGKKEKIQKYIPKSFDADLLNYVSKGFKAKLKGKEKVNNINCFKIILTKNNNQTTYYFSTSNYYLIQEITKEEIFTYSDYKKSGKYIFPYVINSLAKDKTSDYSIHISSIETNVVIDNKVFKN